VAKELAFEQVFWDCPTVDCDERLVSSTGQVVDLVGHQLLAGARLPQHQDREVRGRDTAQDLEYALHGGAGAEHPALGGLLELVAQIAIVDTELVEQQRVVDDQGGLGREHLEQGQVAVREQVGHRVVAQVDHPEQVLSIDERHAHHRGQPQVHHRLSPAEAGIGHRIGDDDRLQVLDDLLDDGIGDPGQVEVLVAHVVGRREMLLSVLEHDDETLFRPGELHQALEKGREQPVWGGVTHHLRGEVDQLLQNLERHPLGRARDLLLRLPF
jgi:hypothetical protein